MPTSGLYKPRELPEISASFEKETASYPQAMPGGWWPYRLICEEISHCFSWIPVSNGASDSSNHSTCPNICTAAIWQYFIEYHSSIWCNETFALALYCTQFTDANHFDGVLYNTHNGQNDQPSDIWLGIHTKSHLSSGSSKTSLMLSRKREIPGSCMSVQAYVPLH